MTDAEGIHADGIYAGGTYEVGTAVPVRAFHTMRGMPPPEGVRHWHDYRLEARVRRQELDERGMVVDLDLLDAALRAAAGEVAGTDLEGVVCPDSVPATVEVFARWLHGRLAGALGPLPGTELAVRTWESQSAYGGYAGPLTSSR